MSSRRMLFLGILDSENHNSKQKMVLQVECLPFECPKNRQHIASLITVIHTMKKNKFVPQIQARGYFIGICVL